MLRIALMNWWATHRETLGESDCSRERLERRNQARWRRDELIATTASSLRARLLAPPDDGNEAGGLTLVVSGSGSKEAVDLAKLYLPTRTLDRTDFLKWTQDSSLTSVDAGIAPTSASETSRHQVVYCEGDETSVRKLVSSLTEASQTARVERLTVVPPKTLEHCRVRLSAAAQECAAEAAFSGEDARFVLQVLGSQPSEIRESLMRGHDSTEKVLGVWSERLVERLTSEAEQGHRLWGWLLTSASVRSTKDGSSAELESALSEHPDLFEIDEQTRQIRMRPRTQLVFERLQAERPELCGELDRDAAREESRLQSLRVAREITVLRKQLAAHHEEGRSMDMTPEELLEHRLRTNRLSLELEVLERMRDSHDRLWPENKAE